MLSLMYKGRGLAFMHFMQSIRALPFLSLLVCLAVLGAPAEVRAQATPVRIVDYRVQPGDTTGAIAEYFYGDQGKAEAIAQHNRLQNVNRISVGQVLEIPYYDWATYRAYAERVGIPVDAPPAAPVAGGSADATVTAPQDPADAAPPGRFLALIAYGVTALALAGGLYWRSRRHTHLTLGAGPARK